MFANPSRPTVNSTRVQICLNTHFEQKFVNTDQLFTLTNQ